MPGLYWANSAWKVCIDVEIPAAVSCLCRLSAVERRRLSSVRVFDDSKSRRSVFGVAA